MDSSLTEFSNVLSIVLSAVVATLSAWFVLRGKKTDAGASVETARINNENDVIAAYGSLQTQLALAAENMVKPLNSRITALQNELDMAHKEIKQLREYVKHKSSEQEALTKRVTALEAENAMLRGNLQRAEAAEKRLRRRLETTKNQLENIQNQMDTGELNSGKHTIPQEEEDNEL